MGWTAALYILSCVDHQKVISSVTLLRLLHVPACVLAAACSQLGTMRRSQHCLQWACRADELQKLLYTKPVREHKYVQIQRKYRRSRIQFFSPEDSRTQLCLNVSFPVLLKELKCISEMSALWVLAAWCRVNYKWTIWNHFILSNLRVPVMVI